MPSAACSTLALHFNINSPKTSLNLINSNSYPVFNYTTSLKPPTQPPDGLFVHSRLPDALQFLLAPTNTLRHQTLPFTSTANTEIRLASFAPVAFANNTIFLSPRLINSIVRALRRPGV